MQIGSPQFLSSLPQEVTPGRTRSQLPNNQYFITSEDFLFNAPALTRLFSEDHIRYRNQHYRIRFGRVTSVPQTAEFLMLKLSILSQKKDKLFSEKESVFQVKYCK